MLYFRVMKEIVYFFLNFFYTTSLIHRQMLELSNLIKKKKDGIIISHPQLALKSRDIL